MDLDLGPALLWIWDQRCLWLRAGGDVCGVLVPCAVLDKPDPALVLLVDVAAQLPQATSSDRDPDLADSLNPCSLDGRSIALFEKPEPRFERGRSSRTRELVRFKPFLSQMLAIALQFRA